MSLLTKEQATIERLIPDINAAHKAFRKSGDETLEYARQIGADLLKIKECVKHGDWEQLIEQRFDFSPQAASGYMKLAAGWHLLKDRNERETATLGGCLKLIGKAKPKKGGNRKSPSISPKAAESNGTHKETSTPQAATAEKPNGPCIRTGGEHRWGPDDDVPGHQCCLECGEPDEPVKSNGKSETGKLFKSIDDYLGKIVRTLDDLNRICPQPKLRQEIFDSLEVANADLRKWKKEARK